MGAIFVLALVAAILLPPVLAAYVLRFILRTVGNHLRRKTSTRRELIFQRAELDEQEVHSNQQPHKTEDEDWERVESYATGTVTNGGVPDDKDFAGVIGFFHPFW